MDKLESYIKVPEEAQKVKKKKIRRPIKERLKSDEDIDTSYEGAFSKPESGDVPDEVMEKAFNLKMEDRKKRKKAKK